MMRRWANGWTKTVNPDGTYFVILVEQMHSDQNNVCFNSQPAFKAINI